MHAWAMYPAFAGTSLSIVGWCIFVRYTYDHTKHFTLSEFGAQTPRTIFFFRLILWVCGPLFALTMFFYVAPIVQSALLTIAFALTIAGEILLGLIPPTGGRASKIHQVLAVIMGIGMLGYTSYFAVQFAHFRLLYIFYLAAMVAISLYAIFAANRRGFVFYELAFIFVSHFSTLTAVLELAGAH